jgi:pyruvate formate lyase activating enzyme
LKFRIKAAKRTEACKSCGFCENYVCPSPGTCAGCGACRLACPYEAVFLEERETWETVTIRVNGGKAEVPARTTVMEALKQLGYRFSPLPEKDTIHAPCMVGGCWSCAVLVDGELRPSCVTPVREAMNIETEIPSGVETLRLVHGFMGHTVGGVGTPWWLKGLSRYIEVACFACGCNLRCPQCQNWTTTYCGKEEPMTPGMAAETMTQLRRRTGVDRMAISGGESTLNRRWLTSYVGRLKKLNPDPEARIHVDTNATLLTPDYIDELVEAGMTDIGPDLKGLKLETFMEVTGLKDKALALKLLENSWRALEYLVDNYWGEIFIGVGVPYNPSLISLEELASIGERLYQIEAEIQVCLLDYRGEFRRLSLRRPSYSEMEKARRILKNTGLKTVIAQTSLGHIGP